MKFIENNNFTSRKVAVFGTSEGNMGIEVDLMADALKHKAAIVPGSYCCKVKVMLSCYSIKVIQIRKTLSLLECLPKRWQSLVDPHQIVMLQK